MSVTPLLYYLPRRTKDYTDHALTHSYNLLEISKELISALGSRHELTEEERYVICLATFLHDLGCLIRRSTHNEFSFKILDLSVFDSLETEVGSDLWTCVRYLALSHSSRYSFRNLPTHKINANVRLDLTCALFRLIDGCDLKQTRTSKNLYKILMQFDPLGKKSQAVWNAHFKVKGIVFKKCRNRVEIIVSTQNCKTSSILTDHLQRDLTKINKILTDKKYGFPSFKLTLNSIR